MDASLVKQLRDKTNAGMMDCKKALLESEGNLEEAVDILRKKGVATAGKKAGRTAKEGIIQTVFSEDKKTAVMAEINCETDFAARNEMFGVLKDAILKKLLVSDAAAIASDGTIVDAALASEIENMVTDAVGKIGENIRFRRCVKYQTGGTIGSYIHMGGKIGVLLEAEGDVEEALLKDVAMQVAAAHPMYLDRAEVPEEALEKEKEIIRAQMQNKPPQVIEKIVSGKLEKFYEEKCLTDQVFVKEQDRKVKDILGAVCLKHFCRFQLGEEV